MPNVQVKWYSVRGKYGFIARDDGKTDVFVHQSAISKSGIVRYFLRTLADEEEVRNALSCWLQLQLIFRSFSTSLMETRDPKPQMWPDLMERMSKDLAIIIFSSVVVLLLVAILVLMERKVC